MKFILAEKKEMTQKFAADGRVIPVTKVLARPCTVVQIKTEATDGYVALQVGCGEKKKVGKSLSGHYKGLGNFRYIREFRVAVKDLENIKTGDKINANVFQPEDKVKVIGVSKGKGFAGVVKRHGFHGSPATHGHKDQLRRSGSIGAGGVQHVMKGMRMAGHMGDEQTTVTNLKIVEVDIKNNEIFVKGAIPGSRNGLVVIVGPGDLLVNTPITEDEPVLEAAEVENVEVIEEVADQPAEPVLEAVAEKSASEPIAEEIKEEVKTEAAAEPVAEEKN